MLDLELVFGQTLIGGFDIVSGGGDGQVVAEVGQQPSVNRRYGDPVGDLGPGVLRVNPRGCSRDF